MHPLSRLLGGASLTIGLALLLPGSDDLRVQATSRPVRPEWTRQPSSNRADNPAAQRVGPDLATRTRISEAYGRLPLGFEKNEGQADPRVEFLSRGAGRTLFLSAAGEATLALSGTASAVGGPPDPRRPLSGARRGPSRPNIVAKGETADDTGAVLRLKLVGASRQAHAEGREKLPGKVNYLRGNDSSQWRAGISTYERVAYENVYPGVDLVYYGNHRRLEYDFIVRPGADPSVIALETEGADRLEVDDRGDLVMHVGNRQVRQQKPVVYQEVEGVRHELDGRYALQSSGRVTFQLGTHDPTLALVIDPVLVYSTYLGGNAADYATDVAVDAAGQAYVTGYTYSSDFSTSGPLGPSPNGNADVFVTKLDAAGSTLVYSAYLGGGSNDFGQAIAVDAAGAAYVTGFTYSSDFPSSSSDFRVPPGYDSIYDVNPDGPTADAFVTKVDPGGATLAYSTFLGGVNDDAGQGIAVDAAGSAYVTGYTYSSEFPATAGAYQALFNGAANAFVTKLDGAGTTLVYSTVPGGAGDDIGQGVTVDAAGHAYVIGYTSSRDFPTTPGAYDTSFHAFLDVFVAKLEVDGGRFAYSTFLGGAGYDIGQGISADLAGNAYVTGYTSSSDFPASPGAYDTTYNDTAHNDSYDVFVTKLDADGASLVYSTFLGGAVDDIGQGIAVNAAGEAYVTGYTDSSADFPSTAGGFNGSIDAFVTKLGASGATLAYSTFLGGSSEDFGQGIAVDRAGDAYVTGYTSSSDFPTSTVASFSPPTEAFVTKIADGSPAPVTLVLSPRGAVNIVGQRHCVTAVATDASHDPVPGVTVRFAALGANSDSGFAVTDENGEALFCYTGTRAGLDTIKAFADNNNDQTYDANSEPADLVEKTYLAGAPVTLILTPPAGTNMVDAQHCVTALVRDTFLNPTPDVMVRFTVTGTVNKDGSQATDSSGQTKFCYVGPLPGVDKIHAYGDTNRNTSQDLGEPYGDATKNWVLPPRVPGCGSVFGIGYIMVGSHWAGFAFDVDQDATGKLDGELGYLAWGRKLFRSTKILQLIVTGNSATIHGLGIEYGGPEVPFRVDVTDNPETFRITWPGYSAGGPVTGEIVISSKCGHDVHGCNGDFHHGDRGDH